MLPQCGAYVGVIIIDGLELHVSKAPCSLAKESKGLDVIKIVLYSLIVVAYKWELFTLINLELVNS